ncbi:hypothetical protein ScalyP_jg9438 [Parmales sp. scaly parma]|nr:hypothetical protein ScalyP_jg9438 [Parmales sp. scaly parma]
MKLSITSLIPLSAALFTSAEFTAVGRNLKPKTKSTSGGLRTSKTKGSSSSKPMTIADAAARLPGHYLVCELSVISGDYVGSDSVCDPGMGPKADFSSSAENCE